MKIKEKRKRQRLGPVQEKILLILMAGAALGLSRSPRYSFKILSTAVKAWQNINQRQLKRSIRALYRSQLVEQKNNKDGTVTMILSVAGKKRALCFNLEKMKIKKPLTWDKKWRLVTFDVPVRLSHLRDSLRYHLKNLGFIEFQKSIFVHPFPCEKEIKFITEFYDIRKFVRFIEAHRLDNELDLKHRFKL